MKEGRTTAKVAMTDPTTLPVEVNPTYVAALIPIGPGVLADCNNIRELLRAHPIINGYYFPLNHGEHRTISSKSKEPDLKKRIE